jgi:hypothetical protein
MVVGRKAAHPLLEGVVRCETDAAALIVARRVQSEEAPKARTRLHRDDEHLVQFSDVHSDHVGSTLVGLTSRSMVCTARVELDTAVSNSA